MTARATNGTCQPAGQATSKPTGPEIREFKGQLARVSASAMRLAADADGRLPQANSQIAGAFDGWTGKEERRRVPWPSETQPNPTQPSHDYFASPKETQQMHRIPANRPQFVSWAALKAQFGQGYGRMDDFRRAFIQTLRLVYGQYQSARFEISAKGMTLYHSLPPVPEA